jgi:adenylate kinase family enzyme
MDRIAVVGTSCSGKTTFAAELATALSRNHVQLDELYWLPDWVERNVEDFRARVATAAAAERWIIDGNYSKSRDLVWSRATHVVWLNYSLPVIFGRAVSRTVRRVATQEELFSGNRESWRKAFVSHDSVLIWVLATFRHNRRKYATLRDSPEWAHLKFIEIRSSAEAAQFVARAGATDLDHGENR